MAVITYMLLALAVPDDLKSFLKARGEKREPQIRMQRVSLHHAGCSITDRAPVFAECSDLAMRVFCVFNVYVKGLHHS